MICCCLSSQSSPALTDWCSHSQFIDRTGPEAIFGAWEATETKITRVLMKPGSGHNTSFLWKGKYDSTHRSLHKRCVAWRWKMRHALLLWAPLNLQLGPGALRRRWRVLVSVREGLGDFLKSSSWIYRETLIWCVVCAVRTFLFLLLSF